MVSSITIMPLQGYFLVMLCTFFDLLFAKHGNNSIVRICPYHDYLFWYSRFLSQCISMQLSRFIDHHHLFAEVLNLRTAKDTSLILFTDHYIVCYLNEYQCNSHFDYCLIFALYLPIVININTIVPVHSLCYAQHVCYSEVLKFCSEYCKLLQNSEWELKVKLYINSVY